MDHAYGDPSHSTLLEGEHWKKIYHELQYWWANETQVSMQHTYEWYVDIKNDLMVWNLFFVTIQWKSKVILVQQFFICHEMTILILITSTYFYNFDKIPSILFCRVDSKKQRNGFPPNYIHSIDASHMMLTSLEMNRYYFLKILKNVFY